MDVDLNSSLICLNVSDLMARISTIDNTSEKLDKLNIYVKKLNAEMLKIKELECDSPLCILVLTQAIHKLEKEILWYTNMKANVVTQEFMPLRAGDSKGKGQERLEKSSDADKKNWMSSIQLGSDNVVASHDITKQSYASHGSSSGVIQEAVTACENPKSQKVINSNKRKSAFLAYQRTPAGVIIQENSSGQPLSGGMFGGLSTVNLDFSRSIATELTYQHSYLIESSKKPRLSWTNDLHHKFVRAVGELGGPAAATPRLIREKMMVDNLTNAEIKSHLQKYRQQIQREYLASNPASAAPSASRSSLTGQGSVQTRRM